MNQGDGTEGGTDGRGQMGVIVAHSPPPPPGQMHNGLHACSKFISERGTFCVFVLLRFSLEGLGME